MPPSSGKFVSSRTEAGVVVSFGKATGADTTSHRSSKEDSNGEWST